MDELNLKLEDLTVPEVNLILRALQALPYVEVSVLIPKIHAQAQRQMNAAAPDEGG